MASSNATVPMTVTASKMKISVGWEHVLVLLLLGLFWGMSVSAIRHKSATFDEPLHLRAGYIAARVADFRLDPENGTLPSRWAAIPLLFAEPRFPEADGKNNNFAEMLFLARMAMTLVGVALGATVFKISKRIWGTAGGLVSLTLYSFSPAMLAQGCLVTSDLTAALFFTLATWAFWKLLHRISLATVLTAGLSFGGLALSKMSAGIFGMLAMAIFALRIAAGRPLEIGMRGSLVSRGRQIGALGAALFACGLLAWASIWAAYSFRYSMVSPDHPAASTEARWNSVLNDPSPIIKAVDTLRSARVLPEAYLFGFAYTLHHSGARTSFLLGEVNTQGFLQFFPLVILLKTPIPFLALLTLAAVITGFVWFRKTAAQDVHLYDLTPLAILCLGYSAVAVASRFNVGERHLFPAYSPLFILAGGCAVWLSAGHWMRQLTVALLLGWFMFESLAIRPHYLAYFNQWAGGPPNGYRCLVDSSLDWGQDLPAIRKWLDDHHCNHPDRTYIAYFGAASLDDYGIRATRLGRYRTEPLPPLAGGTYCVSATTLQATFSPIFGRWNRARDAEYRALTQDIEARTPADSDAQARAAQLAHLSDLREARLWAFLRNRTPDEQIAYSVLVYRLSDQDLDQALHGPPPELE